MCKHFNYKGCDYTLIKKWGLFRDRIEIVNKWGEIVYSRSHFKSEANRLTNGGLTHLMDNLFT